MWRWRWGSEDMSEAQSYPYDMTVIVPVYNAEEYLARCVASLDAQTMPQDCFEVVLVNDGSVDGSLALCQQLAQERSNYVVLSHENRGVSATRNVGMDAARGRYLMFLDPDDELSAPSIAHLVATFDQLGDQVDLVTYPLTYHEVERNYDHRHKRQVWLTRTGIYDLDEYPQIAKNNINVCVRNEGREGPRFDERLRLCEDQRFNTEILSSKAMLGYCFEAEYIYWRYKTGTAATRPLNEESFANVVGNYEYYAQLAQEHRHFARYAYALIVYDSSWRFRQDRLLPKGVNEEVRVASERRMYDVLAAVPFESWIESPYLSDTLRVYQMQRCSKLDMLEQIAYENDGTVLRFADGCDVKLDQPKVTIAWLMRRHDDVLMRGYVYGPSFLLEEEPVLTVQVGEASIVVPLEPSVCDDERTGISITKAWQFELSLPAMRGKGYDVESSLAFGKRVVSAFDIRFDLLRCNGRMINGRMREFGDWRVTIEGQKLHVSTIRDLPQWTMPLVLPLMRVHDKGRTGNYDAKRVNELREHLPRALRTMKGRRTWLYDDALTGTSVLDRLRQDAAADDGVVRKYVVEDACAPQEVYEAGGVPVVRGSEEHITDYLGAEVLVASSGNLDALRPCDKAVFERVRDFTRVDQRYVLLAEHPDPRELVAFDECDWDA